MPTMNEIGETKQKFHQLARESYPDVGEPETVWVLCEVLGWEYERIQYTAVDGFGRDGYRIFIKDDSGKRILAEDGTTLKVSRPWTKSEKAKLKDWWWLLGL